MNLVKFDIKKTSRLILLAACLIVIFLILSACGGEKVDPSELGYLDKEVAVTGITDEDITIKISDLIELESVKKKVETKRSNGEIVEITAVGPALNTFLKHYGKKQTDYTSVRFHCTDGYTIAVEQEILEEREPILAYMDGSKPLDKDADPLALVVPGERAMYWARMINKISFEQDDVATYSEKVVFLDSALPKLKGEYSKKLEGDIVSTSDLMKEFGGGKGKVKMIASDGLMKNETEENFVKGNLKYTGKRVPQFTSPDLPEGMHMFDLVSIRTESVLYYSLKQAEKVLEERTAGDKKGLGLSDIAKGNSLAVTGMYDMTSRGGDKITFTDSEIVDGVFYKDNNKWNFYINDDKKIDDVMIVEAID